MSEVVQLFPSITIAMPTGVKAQGHTLRNQLQTWSKRIEYRRMLRDELMAQPDSVLADAGQTRAALRREVAKPFWRA